MRSEISWFSGFQGSQNSRRTWAKDFFRELISMQGFSPFLPDHRIPQFVLPRCCRTGDILKISIVTKHAVRPRVMSLCVRIGTQSAYGHFANGLRREKYHFLLELIITTKEIGKHDIWSSLYSNCGDSSDLCVRNWRSRFPLVWRRTKSWRPMRVDNFKVRSVLLFFCFWLWSLLISAWWSHSLEILSGYFWFPLNYACIGFDTHSETSSLWLLTHSHRHQRLSQPDFTGRTSFMWSYF